MTAYYNEIDPFTAQWLRNLIGDGHIAPGEVDERSIDDVQPSDLHGFTQCHFFAGIGVWSYALRSAGWPDTQPVWTGSCPCQPFSVAGRRLGTADKRHLWPTWFRLIRECRPEQLFGEQVAGPAALAWFDAVSADLEDTGYAVGAADLCAAGVGAPHIRQRLYWTALTQRIRSGERRMREQSEREEIKPHRLGAISRMGDAGKPRGRRDAGTVPGAQAEGGGQRRAAWSVADEPIAAGTDDRMADPDSPGLQRKGQAQPEGRLGHSVAARTVPLSGFWRGADWLPCRDGKTRPVEPGTFPLAHGVAGRVGRLRSYGNALCAPVAVEFIKSVMSAGSRKVREETT